MAKVHRQVPVLDFECDEEIAELIALMNACGIETIMSCQDNNYGRGTARRVWVDVYAEDVVPFLELLERTGESADMESLSNRMAVEDEPDEDWEAFREDRSWHYRTAADRLDGELLPLAVSIRFPHADLAEVVTRLRSAALQLAETSID